MSSRLPLCRLGLTVALLLAFSSGCATVTKEALKHFEPEQRAEYRDGLDTMAESYDSIYDRDGMEK